MPKENKDKKKRDKKKEKKKQDEGDEPVGAKALRGEEELIQGKIFGPFSVNMQVEGKGELIQIYDPSISLQSPPYWEHEDEENRETGFVPASYKVWVVKAHVAFTPAASQASP